MTKLLDQAIAKARELPEHRQDAVAEALFAHLAGDQRAYSLTPDQIEDVRRIQANLRSGETRVATERELAALWSKCGL